MPARVRVLSGPSLRPSLLLAALIAPGAAPFPLGESRCSAWHLGRTATWHAFRALGLREGDCVLLPAYHCGSEVDPAVHLGLEVELYPLLADLAPDLEALRPLARRAKALYVTHYFGFPQPVQRIAAFAREHDSS